MFIQHFRCYLYCYVVFDSDNQNLFVYLAKYIDISNYECNIWFMHYVYIAFYIFNIIYILLFIKLQCSSSNCFIWKKGELLVNFVEYIQNTQHLYLKANYVNLGCLRPQGNQHDYRNIVICECSYLRLQRLHTLLLLWRRSEKLGTRRRSVDRAFKMVSEMRVCSTK